MIWARRHIPRFFLKSEISRYFGSQQFPQGFYHFYIPPNSDPKQVYEGICAANYDKQMSAYQLKPDY